MKSSVRILFRPVVAVAVLCAACVTQASDAHRLELDKSVGIAVPDGFQYKARLENKTIIGGGPKPFFDKPGDLIEKNTPKFTYLFVAQLFKGIEGHGDVTLIHFKWPVDLADIRRSIATDLDSLVENEEKVAAPGAEGNKLVHRLSLVAREIGGYAAVDHEVITLRTRDLFSTSPEYHRTLQIFRPDGMIRLDLEYSRRMSPDAEGTPRSWTPKDGSPLLAEPEVARKFDALLRSLEVMAPPQ
jgi:hypothetical protein